MSSEARQLKPVLDRAVRQDCIELAKCLRKADLDELSHVCGLDPESALLYSFACSDFAYTAKLGDQMIMMFGVGGIPGMGVPWMLASDLLMNFKVKFVRECRPYVHAMLQRYGHLENWVWAGNAVHIQWLKWLGFTILDSKPYGIDGEPFHRFYMTR